MAWLASDGSASGGRLVAAQLTRQVPCVLYEVFVRWLQAHYGQEVCDSLLDRGATPRNNSIY